MSPRAGRRDNRAAASADHRPEGDRGRAANRPRRHPRTSARVAVGIRAAARMAAGATSRISPGRWSAAGAGGVVLTLAGAGAGGVFSSRDEGMLAVDTRLARVEQQLRELAAKPLAGRGRHPKAVDDLGRPVARLETVVATPQAADHRSRAGEPHRDPRRRPQGAGRARRRARAAQRRHRGDRGRSAHARRCGHGGVPVARIEEDAGAGRADGEAGRDRSAGQRDRRARARREGDGERSSPARCRPVTAPIVRCGWWWSRARSMPRSSAARRSPPSSPRPRPPRPIRKGWRRSNRSRNRACRARRRSRASSRR